MLILAQQALRVSWLLPSKWGEVIKGKKQTKMKPIVTFLKIIGTAHSAVHTLQSRTQTPLKLKSFLKPGSHRGFRTGFVYTEPASTGCKLFLLSLSHEN